MSKLFYTPREVAQILKISIRTLANKRALGTGAPYYKDDGVIRYPIVGLEHHINKKMHHNAKALR